MCTLTSDTKRSTAHQHPKPTYRVMVRKMKGYYMYFSFCSKRQVLNSWTWCVQVLCMRDSWAKPTILKAQMINITTLRGSESQINSGALTVIFPFSKALHSFTTIKGFILQNLTST